jgi:PEP-CTERM motif-containing protein
MRAIALIAVCLLSLCPRLVSASPFASEVVSYTPGTNVQVGYTDPNQALGSPSRTTGTGAFDGDVTPFNAPYQASDLVSIGAGGSLTVRFDHPVYDDVSNPYGIDLLVFGNAFLGLDFGTGKADGTLVFAEPGHIQVSQDGVHFVDAAGVFADSLFPTLGFQNTPGPFDFGGTVPTSFTKPVNPALTAASFAGLDIAGVSALYAGSGGGAGIDLGALGLPWIEYVRVYQPAGDTFSTEVDAFADVPEPGALTLLGVSAWGVTWSRARRSRPSRRAAACGRALARA